MLTSSHQRVLHEQDRRRVRAVLRLLEDHLAAEQFDTILGPEDVRLGKALVFDPSQLPGSQDDVIHPSDPMPASRRRQCRQCLTVPMR
jgi:hypothetical protein